MADMLASLVDLATLLGKTVDDPLDNSSGTLALEVATAVVQSAAGARIVRVVDDTVTVSGGLGSYLRLPEAPVISVASATLDGVSLSAGTASGTYRLTADGRVYRDLGWAATCEPSTAVFVYTHGYLSTDQGIQVGRSACLSVAATAYENPLSATSERIDDYAVTYERAAAAMDASPALRAMLRRTYGRKAGLVSI